MRDLLLPLSMSCVLLFAACGGSEAGAKGPRPNVLLVSIDTLRADHLSAYGYERETSPRIDALAAEGLLFEQAYSQSPKTGPSHMTILTGLYPDAHGVMNLATDDDPRLSAEVPTLASLLASRGYRTAAVTEGGHMTRQLGFDQGFELYQQAGDPGLLGGASNIIARARELAHELAASAQPFFLFVHTYSVHDPYTPPEKYRGLWADPGYEGRIISNHQQLVEASGDDWGKWHRAYWDRVDPDSEADQQHLRDLYDACIRYTDDEVGFLIDELVTIGVDDDTLIVILSDHGEEFGEHGGFLHETVYQEVLHVPLIVRPPARIDRPGLRGRREEAVVRLVDVMPTILDLVGLDTLMPREAVGRSLLEGLPPAPQSLPVLSHWPRKGLYAVRRGNWKLIRADDALELYDLAADPAEREDLADTRPEPVETLGRELDALRQASLELRAAWRGGSAGALDEATRRNLQQLGYLDADG